ncbi:MAG: thrombospondin type 3 repeat-containing protein, partial [Aggregatilineales bacterium]
ATNPAQLQYLSNYLTDVHGATDFNNNKVALLIVDNLEHGAQVEEALAQINLAIANGIVGDVSNIVIEFIDVSSTANNYDIELIAAEIAAAVTRLEGEGVNRFVVNMSFGLLPCEDEASGWDFNQAVEYVETINNAPAPAKPVENILETVCINPDGSYTAHFGYENAIGAPLTVPFGPDNAFTDSPYMGDANRAGTPQYFGYPVVVDGRPGRSPFFPNSAFQLTWYDEISETEWEEGEYEPAVTPEAEYEGSEGDADGDGFPNNIDECPYRGNEGGLGVDETGCPYYDADWDGVYDRNDECPWRGDEYGYGIDEVGCPLTSEGGGSGSSTSIVWNTFGSTETASQSAAVPCDTIMNPSDIYEEYEGEGEYEGEEGEGEGWIPPVEPLLECVAVDDDGNYVAHLGYRNNMHLSGDYSDNGVMVTAYSGLNSLSGGGLSDAEIDVLLPHYFGPGYTIVGESIEFFVPADPGRSLYFPDSAFQIPFNPAEGALVWELYGMTVTADASSNGCAFPDGYGLVDYVKDVLNVPEDEVNEYFTTLMNDDDTNLNALQAYLNAALQRSATDPDFRLVAVASAGNYAPFFIDSIGSAPPLAPARWKETIGVSATLGASNSVALWDFSHNGNVAVPGGGFEFMQDFAIMGTSFAAPQVSRIIADWLTLDDACVFNGDYPPIFDTEGVFSNYRVDGAATAAQPVPNPFNCSIDVEPPPPPTGTPVCEGLAATIYVEDGKIVGGSQDGRNYSGRLNGTSGADVIVGTDAKDTINGRDGNDIICGLDGNDVLRGNEGRDTIYGDDGRDNINGNNGNDTLYGGADNDTLYGSNGRDTMYGDAGDDRMNGQNEDDTMYGGDGNDRMNGNNGRDTMFGDAGNDTMSGGNDGDEMHGGIGEDTMRGNGGRNFIYGDGDNDKLYGGSSVDTIGGGDGDDLINGSGAGDDLSGDAGDDNINAGGGRDTIDGGADTDTCNGGGDSDTAINCETQQSIP